MSHKEGVIALPTPDIKDISLFRLNRVLLYLVTLLACLILPIGVTKAADESIVASLPSFQVTLNGVVFDSRYAEYPLIVYQDVTYFPMTFYDCRYLGLETAWDAEAGLAITSTGISSLFREQHQEQANSQRIEATAVSFPVRVNNTVIESNSEQYPLLLFRGVTYFPLTWRFCHTEFGWDYNFSLDAGLEITSRNPSLERLDIELTTEIEPQYISFTVANGFFYTHGNNGDIIQGSLLNPSETRTVFNLPSTLMSPLPFALGNLSTKDNTAYLQYLAGSSPVMSATYVWRLNDDGSCTEVARGASGHAGYGEGTIQVDMGVPPYRGNFYLRQGFGNIERQVGNPNLYYGWIFSGPGAGSGWSPKSDLHLIGDTAYLLANDYNENDSQSGTTSVYKVNLLTDETTRLVDDPVHSFLIEGDYLYYLRNADRQIYSFPLAGGDVELVSKEANARSVIGYNVLSGRIYYVTKDHGKYSLWNSDNSAPILGSDNQIHLEVLEGYLSVTFGDTYKNQYSLIVINGDGKIVFKTADNVIRIAISEDVLYYLDGSLLQVASASLKDHQSTQPAILQVLSEEEAKVLLQSAIAGLYNQEWLVIEKRRYYIVPGYATEFIYREHLATGTIWLTYNDEGQSKHALITQGETYFCPEERSLYSKSIGAYQIDWAPPDDSSWVKTTDTVYLPELGLDFSALLENPIDIVVHYQKTYRLPQP